MAKYDKTTQDGGETTKASKLFFSRQTYVRNTGDFWEGKNCRNSFGAGARNLYPGMPRSLFRRTCVWCLWCWDGEKSQFRKWMEINCKGCKCLIIHMTTITICRFIKDFHGFSSWMIRTWLPTAGTPSRKIHQVRSRRCSAEKSGSICLTFGNLTKLWEKQHF